MTKRILTSALQENRTSLLEPEAKIVCSEYEIPTPPSEVTKDPEQAVLAARRLGYPIVLKIVSRDILHKTEAHGVLLNIIDDKSVEKGFTQITNNARDYRPEARIEGVLVQKMAPQGIEAIIGGIVDSQFGQVVMFGLGGVFAEILKDVTFRVAPIQENDAREMMGEIKGYPLLRGYRNQPPADEESIVKILIRTSKVMMDNEEIDQMDLNPVMIYPKGASVVDARIILKQPK